MDAGPLGQEGRWRRDPAGLEPPRRDCDIDPLQLARETCSMHFVEQEFTSFRVKGGVHFRVKGEALTPFPQGYGGTRLNRVV